MRELFSSTKRQLGNPVRVELVCRVEIGDAAVLVGRKCVDQLAAVESLVVTNTRSCGGDIDRLGICVVDVKLHAIAHLLSKSRLKRVVVRAGDRTPPIHAGELSVEHVSYDGAGRGHGIAEVIVMSQSIGEAVIEVDVA